MATYGVSITKSLSWNGHVEQFSNVYHYNLATTLDATLGANLVDQITAFEKQCHTASVTFEFGRVWEVGGTPAENETIIIQDVSGTGTQAETTALYRELALVARVETTRTTSTGRRIYLRKYYHSCGLATTGTSQALGTAVLDVNHKSAVKACLENVRELTLTPGSVAVFLCAPGGQQVSDTRPVTVLDYVHVRQFRR